MVRAFLVETLRPYRWAVAAVVLLSVLASLFDGLSIAILVPTLANLQNLSVDGSSSRFGWLLTWIPSDSPFAIVYASMVLVVIASIGKNVLHGSAIRIGHWLSTRLLADLRLRAVTTLLNSSLAFHHRSRLGDLLDRTITGTFTAEGLIRLGIEFLAGVITLIVLVAVLFLLSWQLTIATIPMAIAFGWWMRRHTRSLLELGRSLRATTQTVVSSIHEALAGIYLIKAYSQETRHIDRLRHSVELSRRIESRRHFRTYWIYPVTDLAGTIGMTLLVLVALRTNGDNMPLLLARLLPFLYVLLRLVPLLKVLNGLRAELIGQWPQVGALAELLRLEDKGFLVDGRRPFAPLTAGIELRDVTLVYEGQPRPALDGVSFRIPAGQTTAIIGESGAGKSTVAAVLLRLVDPTAGAVLLDGTPLTEFRLASYHAAIGVVSQDTFLFNDTVRFNIAFGASGEPDDAEVIDAARQAGAHDFIMELANGYDTPLGDRGVRLSGGQRQRIAIARAIIRRPQILILDEATSSLDTATERRIHDALRELSRNRTVVIIAHRLSTIEDADWLVELGHGRVLRAVPNDSKSKVAGQEDNIVRIRHS
jgi:ABC-type multidrug transport system fused ATPase/permease subunit